MKTNRICLNGNAIALIVGLLIHLNVNSQAVVGIYLTAQDFKSGYLSFSKKDDSCKVRVRSASERKKIKIKCGGTVRYLNKDSVYGYKDKEATVFRFYHRTCYKLKNPDEEILLYEVQVSNPDKYEPAIVSYYFSRDFSSPVYPLTINNVLRVFSENKRFTNMVELRYKYDSDLLEYDSYHKKNLLNCLLETSKN
jgi:hypothetical protein